jgi:hypothetical protein
MTAARDTPTDIARLPSQGNEIYASTPRVSFTQHVTSCTNGTAFCCCIQTCIARAGIFMALLFFISLRGTKQSLALSVAPPVADESHQDTCL